MNSLPGHTNHIKHAYTLAAIIAAFFIIRMVFILNANLLVEEAYYWNYSTHMDFSYLDHPPMVAVLIKAGTLLFGHNEWGVRFATIICWCLTCLFSYKLTQLIKKGAGIYSVFLLSILPFFFIHSLIITPDIPLILCWSAALYYLYNALVLEQPRSWYWVGIWLGLGLASKYTIVLLGPVTLCYVIGFSSARYWLKRKEPYIGVLICMLIFSPVIYWNYLHQWESFIFQSTRRLQGSYTFSFHIYLGLLLAFLTPAGLLAAMLLFVKKHASHALIDLKSSRFLQLYSLAPLLVFMIFSLFHQLKINWIGPILLAFIPWIAILLSDNVSIAGYSARKNWMITTAVLFICYSLFLTSISLGYPKVLNDQLFSKILYWKELTQEVNTIAHQLEKKNHTTPVIVPLDAYKIGSELAFYQQVLFDSKKITTIFPVVGSHVFGYNSLMYKYWADERAINDKTVLLVAKDLSSFEGFQIGQKTLDMSPVIAFSTHAAKQARGTLYYKIVKTR